MTVSHFNFFTGASKQWKFPLAAVFITIIWLYLWYFPWQDKLHHIYWLQLGGGLAIFIVPGACVYGLLKNHSNFEFNHVTFGFVISHLIFAIPGLVGRFIHLSFDAIEFIMMALGLILLLFYVLPKIEYGIKFNLDKEQFAYILSILPALFVSIMVSLIVIQRVVNSDDLTYLAYLNNLQQSPHLGFHDLIFGAPQVVSPRFWLISTPFAQAFLAEISRMPGILILSGYYEPFLIILSVLCWYEFAIALKLSPRAASASVILQLSFLLLLSEYIHPGAPYLNQLSADKATAAFILAPVFFQSLIRLLERATRSNMLLLLLTGFSLSFMHPIILAYSAFIGGILILLNKKNPGFKNKLKILTILILILIPQVIIRFIKIPSTAPISYDPEVILNQGGSDNLVAQWGNTPYYGFTSDILAMKLPYEADIPLPDPILQWGWLLVPTFAVIFALKQRDNSIAQFILSCFALCFLTWLPLTGWIFGYFLNARMLARSVWLFPYGLSTVYILLITRDYIRNRPINKTLPIISSNWALTILTVTTIGLFALYMRENKLPDIEMFNKKAQRYQDLAIAGQALDDQIIDQAFVMGSPNLNDLIPGISAKSKLITFRISNPSNMFYFTSAERDERITDTETIFSKSTSPEDKLSLLEKYHIQFLFLQRADIRLFNNLIEKYPEKIKASEVGGVIIVEIDQ